MSHHLRRARLCLAAAFFIGAACLSAPAWAGSLRVDPVWVELTNDKRIASVTVRNEEEVPVTIRAYGLTWDQHDGSDVYGETSEVIVSPPVFAIPAGGTQTIRIGLRQSAGAARAYRLVIEEVPQANPEGGIRIALRLNLPLFAMQRAGSSAELTWFVSEQPDHSWILEATNATSTYVRIVPGEAAAATGIATESLGYLGVVLPNSRRRWTLREDLQVDNRATFQRAVRNRDDRQSPALR